MRRPSAVLPWLVAAVLASGCGAVRSTPIADATTAGEMRVVGREATDGEVVGRWLLGEMFAPGGTPEEARKARTRLDRFPHDGMWASLARAIFDDEHGDPRAAADGYVAALRASAGSNDAEAPLVAWFAVRHLIALRGSVSELFARYRPVLDAVLAHPGNVGWRAVTDLEDWRSAEVYDKSERTGGAFDEEVVRRMGCARDIRIAGPFGHGVPADADRSFPAEAAAPWPPAWPADPVRGSVPRVVPVIQSRCTAVADAGTEDGVFYLETFFATNGDRELVVAVQGATALWIDGSLVATRSEREWGSWQRFGVHVSVSDGRHRVLARTVSPAGSVRLLNPDGSPAGLPTDGDDRAGFTVVPPTVLSDPNPIDAAVHALSMGAAPALSPVGTALAAFAASVDQIEDVASALVAPLVERPDAAVLSLEMAAASAASDPAWPGDARGPRSRALRDRALARDPRLWRAHLDAILDGVSEHGLADAVDPLRTLANDVPNEPDPLEQLARLYSRLGWRDDRMRTLRTLSERFPDDVDALRDYLDALDDDGPSAEADRVAVRIKALDPDSDVALSRALARRDYDAAIREIRSMAARSSDRKDVAGNVAARLADVLTRAGKSREAAAELDKALARHPGDAQARFRLADRAFAGGDESALRRALAAALQANASTVELRAAIDLVEGATDLEPYRQDGRAVVTAFQEWERAGHHMDGTAARVLDYAAVWVHDDGSSEMLEHEIQKIQSQEAIHSESETDPPGGLVLHLRVIKPDGRVLEPEPVSGKPTLTLPHVEVGDFVEVEHITSQPGDGAHGRHYVSPQWFFREGDKGYWRSEFVVITPADRKLDVETRGNVPPPKTKTLDTFVENRWRVDLSPPAELEPDSPPVSEFLPSVRVGWGASLADTVARLTDLATDQTPLDPRLRAIAVDVVRGTPASSTDERARRLYRWVLENVQDGKETDGRRVVTGRSGARQQAFKYLLRLVGIESELAIAKNRLAMPPIGPMSEVEQYDSLVLRLATDRGVRWLTVRDKFAPFGYVPTEWRDQPAVRLVAGAPGDVVRAPGAVDGVKYEGRADVHEDGSAVMDLTLTFEGNRAIAWRTALDQIPRAKVYDFVERELVAPSFDGGHVRDLKVEHAPDLDVPLVLRVRVEVPEMAKPVHAGLSLHPPFAPPLAQLASLPNRRTPLLLRASRRAELNVSVVLPPSMHVPARLPTGRLTEAGALVEVTDAVDGHVVDFRRVIDLPSGRIQPGDEYARWQKFAEAADALVTRDVLVSK